MGRVEPVLDSVLITFSSWNTLLLFWLGFVTIFHSHKRDFVYYLLSFGILLAAIFFAIHSQYILSILNTNRKFPLFVFLWILFAIHTLPCVWLLIVSWFYLRKDVFLILIYSLPLAIVYSLFLKHIEFYIEKAELFQFYQAIPIQIRFIYGIYILLYSSISVSFLYIPSFQKSIKTDIRKLDAKPFLKVVSILLWLISFFILLYILWNTLHPYKFDKPDFLYSSLKSSDICISFILSILLIFFGKILIMYGIFQTEVLPQASLIKEWHFTLILSFAIALIFAFFQKGNQAGVLWTGILVAIFRAKVFANVYRESTKSLHFIREFLKEQKLYELIYGTNTKSEIELEPLFYTICKETLNCEFAVLIFISHVIEEKVFVYPNSKEIQIETYKELRTQLKNEGKIIFLDRNKYKNAVMAIPIYMNKKLSGFLVLGNRVKGGLYTEEEIELSRAGSERIIELLLIVNMSRVLLKLQKQALLEDKLKDYKIRRILHDEILPDIHSLILQLSDNKVGVVQNELANLHKIISESLKGIPVYPEEIEKLGFIKALYKSIRTEVENIKFVTTLSPQEHEKINQMELGRLEVLYYACREVVRNSSKYAKSGNVELNIEVKITFEEGIKICITDNGNWKKGIKGTGQGLIIHTAMLTVVGGNLEKTTSVENGGTQFILLLPL